MLEHSIINSVTSLLHLNGSITVLLVNKKPTMSRGKEVTDELMGSGFETARRRKGKKRNGSGKRNGEEMIMRIRNDIGDYGVETSDTNDEVDGVLRRVTSSDSDGKLAVDAVRSNSPTITIIEAEQVTPLESSVYLSENALGNVETPTTPIFKITEKNDEVATPVESGSENVLYNTRALSKYAATYELENFEKNALIIFNQVNVDGYSKPRHGTEKDVEALRNTFEKFGFEVVEHRDFTKEKIFSELKTCMYCFVIIIVYFDDMISMIARSNSIDR